MATTSIATVSITINSSYVDISTTPFRKTRNGIESRLFGCLGKYIILSGIPARVGRGIGLKCII